MLGQWCRKWGYSSHKQCYTEKTDMNSKDNLQTNSRLELVIFTAEFTLSSQIIFITSAGVFTITVFLLLSLSLFLSLSLSLSLSDGGVLKTEVRCASAMSTFLVFVFCNVHWIRPTSADLACEKAKAYWVPTPIALPKRFEYQRSDSSYTSTLATFLKPWLA